MNCVDENLQILDGRVGQNAVTQVEDVTVSAGSAAKHAARPLANNVRGAEQHSRVEVPLNAQSETDAAPSLVERHAPVEGHDVRPRLRYGLEQACGIGAEMDARHA